MTKDSIIQTLADIDPPGFEVRNLYDADLQPVWNVLLELIKAAQAMQEAGDIPLKPLLKLYYIYHQDEDGNDNTVFVRATSPQAAWRHWRDSLDEVEISEDIWVREVVPVEGQFGVVDWGKFKMERVRTDGNSENEE